MRIALDARPALDPRRTGVGHYTRQIVRYLPIVDPLPEYVAWYLHAKGVFSRARFFDDVGAPNLTERASRFPARVFQPMAWRLRAPRLEWLLRDFDALLATNFVPPPTKRPGVVLVVHDLAYAVMPDTAPHHDRRWKKRFAAALKRAAGVIVPSEATRRDLLGASDVDGDDIHVIPHGVEPFERPEHHELEPALARLRITGPYALFVGGIEPRKNLHGLLEAFRRVDTDAQLVVAGGPVNWIPGESGRLEVAVAALPEAVRRRIVMTGYVSDADKRALLAGATVLAYPSLYEGFGFPVLEGFAAGVPVLTSTTSSLPEVAGDAAMLVDPRDPGEIASGLQRLLSDGGLRQGLVAAGRERVRTYTWERTASATAEVLKAAGDHAGTRR